MATLKCLACGHDNKVGDESCASCSSSLNLRLCSACEAINANSAPQCHSCGAHFGAEAEVTSPAEEVGAEAPADEKILPAAWVVGAEQATRRSRRATAALWLVVVLGMASFTYYFYGAQPQPAPKQLAAEPPAPAAAAELLELKVPPPEIKQPPAPKVVVQPAPTPVAQARTAFEPKRALAPVTHTRDAGVATPVKTIPAAAPAVPAVAAPVVAAAVSESAPVVVERRARVTHTRTEPSEAPVAGAGPSVVPVSVPGTAAKVEPAPCAPAVAALGLCKSN